LLKLALPKEMSPGHLRVSATATLQGILSNYSLNQSSLDNKIM